eukprot:gene10534-7472_t
MGSSSLVKRLDAILVVQERTATQIKKFSRGAERVLESSRNLANWGHNQRKSYERQVWGVLVRYLEKQGYEDVYAQEVEEHRKTGYFVREDGVGVDTAQWDGLIQCVKDGVEMVFFLEAKKTQNTSDMLSMPDRMQRTLRFVEACHSRRVPEPGARQRFKNLCLMWSTCHGRQARGVLAADDIPSSAMDMAVREGYLTIRCGDGAFEMQDMQAGTSAGIVVPEGAGEPGEAVLGRIHVVASANKLARVRGHSVGLHVGLDALNPTIMCPPP